MPTLFRAKLKFTMLIWRVAGRLSRPINLANLITSAEQYAKRYRQIIRGVFNHCKRASDAGILILNSQVNTHASLESS